MAQEEVRIKREQQKQAGPQRQGTSDDQPPKGPKPALKGEQGHQGAGAFKSKSVLEQEHPVSIRVKIRVLATRARTFKSTTSHPEEIHETNLGITQSHAGLKAPWIQAGEGIEVHYGKEDTPSKL